LFAGRFRVRLELILRHEARRNEVAVEQGAVVRRRKEADDAGTYGLRESDTLRDCLLGELRTVGRQQNLLEHLAPFNETCESETLAVRRHLHFEGAGAD